jgi:hypothetical protein
MLYPTLPPTLPAVVSVSTPSPTATTSINSNRSQGSDTQQNLASSANANMLVSTPINYPSFADAIASSSKSTISNVSSNQSTVPQSQVSSDPQPPEFSPLSVNHEAKLLGETLSVGYQNKSNDKLEDRETESESSPVMLKEPIFQSLNTGDKPDNKNTASQLQQQPVIINFNSGDSNSGSGEQTLDNRI